MWQNYAPEPRMRINLGIRRRLAPLLDGDRRKIELVNSLLFTLPGSPILYYGDEIGMGDNIWLPDRNGVRTPMQWNDGPNAGFSQAAPGDLYAPIVSQDGYQPQKVNVEQQQADPSSLWHVLCCMIAARKQYKAIGRGSFDWVTGLQVTVAAYWRSYPFERLLIINNLADYAQTVQIDLPASVDTLVDSLSGEQVHVGGTKLTLNLEAYQYRWLKL